jgi:cell division protein FtsN
MSTARQAAAADPALPGRLRRPPGGERRRRFGGGPLAQRGGFVLGIVVGLLAGLALALGVALYITKAPVPFVNKVPARTAEQDNAEAERNKNWDPNAPLAGKAKPPPSTPASAAAQAALAAASAALNAPTPPPPVVQPPPARDPAAILSGGASTAPGPESFIYFVQAGAYTRTDEAEQQRAKLAMIGFAAKVSEREQSGRTVHRVRVGPYDSREEADGVQARLTEAGIEARLVRVEKQ